jgi:ribonuclease E
VKSALAQIAASTIHHHEEPVAPAESSVAVPVDAPVEQAAERPKKPRKKRTEKKGPKSEKEILLDSVLNALPEPKAPGQGRSRRRVTTAALTGTPVPHLPTPE